MFSCLLLLKLANRENASIEQQSRYEGKSTGGHRFRFHGSKYLSHRAASPSQTFRKK